MTAAVDADIHVQAWYDKLVAPMRVALSELAAYPADEIKEAFGRLAPRRQSDGMAGHTRLLGDVSHSRPAGSSIPRQHDVLRLPQDPAFPRDAAPVRARWPPPHLLGTRTPRRPRGGLLPHRLPSDVGTP